MPDYSIFRRRWCPRASERVLQWSAPSGGDVAATTRAAGIAPASAAKVDRIDIAYRSDQSWAHVQVEVTCAGRRYLQDEPLYAAERKWAEVEAAPFPAGGPSHFPAEPISACATSARPARNHPVLAVTIHLHPTNTVGGVVGQGHPQLPNGLSPSADVPLHRHQRFAGDPFHPAHGLRLVAISLRLRPDRLPRPGILFGILLATMMIPAQVTMIPVFLINKSLGWFNTLYPLWVPAMFGSAFFIFMMRQFFLAVPRELEDAARIDGCGFWRSIGTSCSRSSAPR